MARIRTIKPEFFTSEDIVALSALARLLYIALWCEADKEGRLVWKPMTFKLRYMPGDDCNIQALCQEILERGLVKLYGEGLAYIPSFSAHQHINPRESASQLPGHTLPPRVGTRQPRAGTGANLNVDAQVGRDGKGSSDTRVPSALPTAPLDAKGSRLAKDWTLPDDWKTWAEGERADLDVLATADAFRDYWISKPGKEGLKLDWQATWRNWCRSQKPNTRATFTRTTAEVFV